MDKCQELNVQNLPCKSNNEVASVVPTVGALVIGSKKFLYPFSMVAMNFKKASCISNSKFCCQFFIQKKKEKEKKG